MELNPYCAVDEKRLFHSGANRMIDVGGLVLLEEKSDIGNWNMGREKPYSLCSDTGNKFWITKWGIRILVLRFVTP